MRRTNYGKLVTNELVIDAINKIALNKEHQAALPAVEVRVQTEETQEEIQVEAEMLQESQSSTQQDTNPNDLPENSTEIQQETADDEEDSGMEVTQDVMQEPVEIKTTRSGQEIKKPSRFMAVMKVMHEEWKSEENAKAINAKIKMLFEDLKALRPVRRASIKGGTKILRSHMFVVEKFLATGEFDKMKARLVADGRDQESKMYSDKASPTVALHSVFTVLGIMATKKWL